MEAADNQELAQRFQQQLMLLKNFASVSHKCFMKCVTKPARNLSSTEETCATNCCQRYMDTQTFLFERLQEKANEEKKAAGMVSQ